MNLKLVRLTVSPQVSDTIMTDRPDGPETTVERDSVIQAAYDWRTPPASTAVIETVAAACGRKLTRLELLYDVIGPDALDTLIGSSEDGPVTDGTTVVSEFADKSVTVHSGGSVVVRLVESGAGDTKE